MKVNQATVNYYLKTAKTLSDGSHPIMLRVCYHGFKDISSHYSCSLKYWDKRNQCIKKGFPNHVIANYELTKLKNSIIARRDEFIRQGIEYTPSMLLSFDEKKVKSLSNVVVELMDYYCSEKELNSSTVNAWKQSISNINEFHKGVIISEIDEGWCKRYSRWLVEKGLGEGTIRHKLGHIACIYRYACGKGLASMSSYPYKDWNYCHHFHESEKLEYVDLRCVGIMKEYFLSKVILKSSERSFSYIDESYVNVKSRLFSLYFWLLGYYLQGLSPIDICLLKKSDFEVKHINGEDYYCIDTHRKKTHVAVKVRVKVHTIFSQVMIGRMLMEGGEYFLPILDGIDINDDVKCKNRVKSVFSSHLNSKLYDWWKELNGVIIQKNVDEHSNIPLINEGCTYYSYRHSYAQAYLQNGGSVLALASLLGRSINTISTYVQQLSEEGDLAKAVSIME